VTEAAAIPLSGSSTTPLPILREGQVEQTAGKRAGEEEDSIVHLMFLLAVKPEIPFDG